MRTKQVFLCLAAQCFFISGAYAQQAICQQYGDTMRCHDGELQGLNYLGNAELNQVAIQQKIRLIGNLHSTASRLNNNYLTGKTTLVRTQVHGLLSQTGESNLANSKLLGEVEITGNYRGNHNHFYKNFRIKGDVQTDHDIFDRDVYLTGFLNATNTEFKQDLNVKACKLEFLDSQLHSVMFAKLDRCQNGRQQLVLKGKTQVYGDINFQGGYGKVVLDKQAVLHGKLTGGVIEDAA